MTLKFTVFATLLLAGFATAGPAIQARQVDEDILNLCFADTSLGCFQAEALIDGSCGGFPRFSSPFGTVSLETAGPVCTLFEETACTGTSALFSSVDTTELATLGLNNVESFSCV
ncbi:hypothetical protein FB45DRAFT_1008146 [Roridomyces roridus]|uniref:Uncharacterized protein n=1 Tax=Roridomyces roridus TaxID=1738132 RepID=A0AAD7FFM6_9AGAR|nr:hypothetical protein FB45DRAFT_1008146 [Roridomyces roridus]